MRRVFASRCSGYRIAVVRGWQGSAGISSTSTGSDFTNYATGGVRRDEWRAN